MSSDAYKGMHCQGSMHVIKRARTPAPWRPSPACMARIASRRTVTIRPSRWTGAAATWATSDHTRPPSSAANDSGPKRCAVAIPVVSLALLESVLYLSVSKSRVAVGRRTRAHSTLPLSKQPGNVISTCKTVKGKSHTVEERTSVHSHRPHATSQPA